MATRVCNTHDRSTDCNQLKPVFEWFKNIFETQQPATRIAPNSGNCNLKIDWTMVQFSLVLWLFAVLWTEPLNTSNIQNVDQCSLCCCPSSRCKTPTPQHVNYQHQHWPLQHQHRLLVQLNARRSSQRALLSCSPMRMPHCPLEVLNSLHFIDILLL